jgi:hypothetical protein
MRSASQRHYRRGSGRPEYLAFTTWRPSARHHLLVLPAGHPSPSGDEHEYETLCGLTPERTKETALLDTGRPATEEEIEREAATPGFLCTRCYRRHRKEGT